MQSEKKLWQKTYAVISLFVPGAAIQNYNVDKWEIKSAGVLKFRVPAKEGLVAYKLSTNVPFMVKEFAYGPTTAPIDPANP